MGDGCGPFVFSVAFQFISSTQLSELQRAERVNVPCRVQGANSELKVRAPLFSHLQQADELLVLRADQGNREPHRPFTAWKGECLPQCQETSKKELPLSLYPRFLCLLFQEFLQRQVVGFTFAAELTWLCSPFPTSRADFSRFSYGPATHVWAGLSLISFAEFTSNKTRQRVENSDWGDCSAVGYICPAVVRIPAPT